VTDVATRSKARRSRPEADSGYARLAITIPKPLSSRLRELVESGGARSISSFVAEAIEEKLERDDLSALLAEMAKEFGPPTPEQKAWADDILAVVAEGQSPSTPEP
jgi:Arc/MetJ-type ribon-helix-helix transcriptional regulator